MAEAIDEAYQEQLAEMIEVKVLRRHKFDGETFRTKGKKLCTETVYNKLCDRIDKINLSARFLVTGFDEKGIGHIFAAGGDESVEGFDHIGLWAIGKGQASALASLSFHVTNKNLDPGASDLDEVICFALESKFMAESADSVGKSTLLVVLEPGKKVKFIVDQGIQLIRKHWLRDGAPRLSKRALKLVPHLLFDSTKATNAEEAKQKLEALMAKPGFFKRVQNPKEKPPL